jgi:hypothetical protein
MRIIALCFLVCLFAAGCDAPPEATININVNRAAPLVELADPAGYEFEEPIQLAADGEMISVDSPGYACPTMGDVDADSKEDLIVGQFSEGKMHFFKNIAATGKPPKFAKSEWIRSGGEPAIVPGVW